MNKGTKIALIALAVLSLVCLIGVWSMFTNAKGVLEKAKEESAIAGTEILILFGSKWDLADIQLRTAKDFGVTADEARAWKGQFGSLILGDPKVTSFDVTSDNLTAVLECKAVFELGPGDVRMTLTREPGNAWLLADFDVTPSP